MPCPYHKTAPDPARRANLPRAEAPIPCILKGATHLQPPDLPHGYP